MIIDLQNMFSDSQSLTSTQISSNVYDMGVAGRDMGVGVPLYVVINVVSALTTADGGTFTVNVEANSAVGLDADTPTVLGTFPVLTATNATAGARFVMALPAGVVSTDRYLGLRYTEANTVSAFTVDAYLTSAPQQEKVYADNIAIDTPSL